MHGRRPAYYILNEGVVREPEFLSGGYGGPAAGVTGAPPSFRFGRMFPRPERRMTAREWFELSEGLVKLGLCMNDPEKYCKELPPTTPDSDITAGYTYLGQFITHEITFDNTQDLPPVEPNPQNLRSPSLDLDSLYGKGPGDPESRRLYDDKDPALLKLGETTKSGSGNGPYPSDLPRDKNNKSRALIGDPRNDENLTVAQTHVAFIKFHNRVVRKLRSQGHTGADLFDCARMQVIRHFQWLVLHDYLPTIVDKGLVDCARVHGPRWFRASGPGDLYMPLEFSAAAFRLGHTMVREAYDWNWHRGRDAAGNGPLVGLDSLFNQTAAHGSIGKSKDTEALPHDWVIDWRRFFRFPEGSPYRLPDSRINMARRIDTHFDMHLDRITGFNHGNLPPEKKAITVRNLLRGFALGLPTGEEVAACVGEPPLPPEEVAAGPYAAVLSTPAFRGKTPLWFYILKEAELRGGNKLGPVGGLIVAETLVGLIKNSHYSILKQPGWHPTYTNNGDAGTESATFRMVDLLDYLGKPAINPYPMQ